MVSAKSDEKKSVSVSAFKNPYPSVPTQHQRFVSKTKDQAGGEDPGQLSDGGVILEEKRDITLVHLELNQCDVSLLLQDYPSFGQLARVLTANNIQLIFGVTKNISAAYVSR